MVGKRMESRKVQKTGLSTLTVSLPKEWVSTINLKPGDQVDLEIMPDGSLSIGPKESKKREPLRKVIQLESGSQVTPPLFSCEASPNIQERSRDEMLSRWPSYGDL